MSDTCQVEQELHIIMSPGAVRLRTQRLRWRPSKYADVLANQACVIFKSVRLLPTDEQVEVTPKDDVVATRQAKETIKTFRLGPPIKSCSLTKEGLKLASSFFEHQAMTRTLGQVA